ncbi:aminomethyl-transferring glycine dehydrogenase subunit GcvPB, partial [Myxococcota bacterium]|nr:aminomethyl-transferring glycine dehydrogenase subunit GcvPB [Myxococcota bacterium]
MSLLWKSDFDRVGEKPIFAKGAIGRMGVDLPKLDIENNDLELDTSLLRETAPELPEVSEMDVVRHYTRLSQLNASIDTLMYPLGSCTMKYNPRVGERVARLPGFAQSHPLVPATEAAPIAIMSELQHTLKVLTGLDSVTLQPAAGAH